MTIVFATVTSMSNGDKNVHWTLELDEAVTDWTEITKDAVDGTDENVSSVKLWPVVIDNAHTMDMHDVTRMISDMTNDLDKTPALFEWSSDE